MHTTATVDYEFVVSGRVVLELDDGATCELGPGDTTKGLLPVRSAAERGQCTAVVLGKRPSRNIPAEVRLQTGGNRVSVLRDRGGRPGGSALLPGWPDGADPWG